MKVLFTRSLIDGTLSVPSSPSRRRHRESDVWQRRFWEHWVRDEDDFQNHLHYVHYNPVKHGLCACPHAWPASSFHRWVARKAYEPDWCCSCAAGPPAHARAPYPADLDVTVGE
jgi:putative transposase